MTSKLVVNTIEADTGISSVSFASSISLSSTSKFFFSDAGIDIGPDTNINRPATGVWGFNINSDEKVRIASNGRVGIGTDSPASLLDIVGSKTGLNFSVDGTVEVNSNQNWNFPTLRLIREASNTANSKVISFLLDGDSASATGLYDNVNLILRTDSAPTAGSASTTLNASLQLTAPSNIILGTNGAQRLFVRGDGGVVIGETNTVPNTESGITVNKGQASAGTNMLGLLTNNTAHPADTWNYGVFARSVVGGSTYSAAVGVYRHTSNNPAGALVISQKDGGSTKVWADNNNVLRIGNTNAQVGGAGGTVVGAQTSDIRLKNNLGSVSYGLTEINQINPIKFSFKKDESNRQQIGFSAQDIQSIIPEAVFNSGCSYDIEGSKVDNTLGMDYVALVPVLINAVKELSQKVAALESS